MDVLIRKIKKLKDAKMSPHHLQNKRGYCKTNFLPHSWGQLSSLSLSECSRKSKECNLPYRTAENVHTSSNCPALRNLVVSVIVRKYNLELYLIFFVVENSSLLLSVPKLIKFAGNLSRDHKALLKLEMNRSSQI